MTDASLASIIAIKLFCKAGRLVSIQEGEASAKEANASPGLQQLLQPSKAATGGPVKTRVLTKSVTAANKETPLRRRRVELD